jgi:hypothetical protein
MRAVPANNSFDITSLLSGDRRLARREIGGTSVSVRRCGAVTWKTTSRSEPGAVAGDSKETRDVK